MDVKIWLHYEFNLKKNYVRTMAIDETNGILYCILNDSWFLIVDMNEKEFINQIKLGQNYITDIILRPEGRKIYISTKNS